DGIPLFKQAEAREAISKVHRDLAKNGPVDLVVSCANGTIVDSAEAAALAESFPQAPVEYLKRLLGDALGASALMQTICGALALEKRGLQAALISCVGLNHQASGAILARR